MCYMAYSSPFSSSPQLMCALLGRLISDIILALGRALTIGTDTFAGSWLTLIPAGVFGAGVGSKDIWWSSSALLRSRLVCVGKVQLDSQLGYHEECW
jgi:hypothetical protein